MKWSGGTTGKHLAREPDNTKREHAKRRRRKKRPQKRRAAKRKLQAKPQTDEGKAGAKVERKAHRQTDGVKPTEGDDHTENEERKTRGGERRNRDGETTRRQEGGNKGNPERRTT